MLFNLIHSPAELFGTAYGRAMALKLVLVAGLLGIAALNKFVLVPKLMEEGESSRFRRSVRIEIVVALLLLILTAYLSTVVGPMEHA